MDPRVEVTGRTRVVQHGEWSLIQTCNEYNLKKKWLVKVKKLILEEKTHFSGQT